MRYSVLIVRVTVYRKTKALVEAPEVSLGANLTVLSRKSDGDQIQTALNQLPAQSRAPDN
jgi:hypothetical protein